MKITVTRDDITEGWRGNCNRCPVALAIRRCIPGAAFVNVGELQISWVVGRMKYWVSPPVDVDRFMRGFDKCLPVQPFEFELNYIQSGLAQRESAIRHPYVLV